MEKLNVLLFLEIISLMICIICHLSSFITKIKFHWKLYPTTAIIILMIFLFSMYIVQPLAQWLNVG